MAQKYDRFNLEEEIQNVWQTKDDLNAITERIYDDPDGPMTDDEISNVLIGLSELHEIRCKKLWRIFETMVREKCFNDTPPKSGYIHPQYNESAAEVSLDYRGVPLTENSSI
jgi:hypothetical protein